MAQKRRKSPDRQSNRYAVQRERPDVRQTSPITQPGRTAERSARPGEQPRRTQERRTGPGEQPRRAQERRSGPGEQPRRAQERRTSPESQVRRMPQQADEHEQERRRKQAARKQAAKRKKQKRRRKIIKWIAILLVVFAVLCGLGYLSTLVFQLKQIKVTKNQYTVSEDVVDWIKQDRYSGNTLYVWWKYNHTEPLALPAAKSVKVKLTSPWEVTVEVEEKTFTGRLELNGEFLYFDENGIASYKSAEVIEGVALVEGAEVNEQEVQLGKKLPVSDETVFENICEIVDLLKQNELEPDKIGFEETNLTLWFGGVQIEVGSGNYETKLEQIPPILAKLNELYPGQSGVLHLENYEQGADSIRFVPERAEQTEE